MNSIIKAFTRKGTQGRRPPSESSKQIVLINVENIIPSPTQPRSCFDEVEIVSLADSIRKHGLIQPITVRKAENSDFLHEKYYIVAGERRLRAFKMLGKTDIPAMIIDANSHRSAELALVENIMRKDLNMFEYARALEQMLEKYNMTQEALAERMSTSQSNVANKLRLLKFEPDEERMIIENSLSERHARALLRISDAEARKSAAEHIISHNLNVRQAESYIDRVLIPEKMVKQYDANYRINDFCNQLIRSVQVINKNGIYANSVRYENDDEIKIVINIPKISSDS